MPARAVFYFFNVAAEKFETTYVSYIPIAYHYFILHINDIVIFEVISDAHVYYLHN